MNKNLIPLVLIPPTLFASTVIAEENILTGNYWRCSTYDAENKEWSMNSSYEKIALNKSYDECKKNSALPKSCKTAKETCEAFVNGVSTRPMWQCTALDQMAKTWPSNVYTHRDDAAIAARAYCQQKSAFPDTCYINLMTCKNLNNKE